MGLLSLIRKVKRKEKELRLLMAESGTTAGFHAH